MSQVTGSRRGSTRQGLRHRAGSAPLRPSRPVLPQRAEGTGWGSPQLRGPVALPSRPACPWAQPSAESRVGRLPGAPGTGRGACPHPCTLQEPTGGPTGRAHHLGCGLVRARCLPEAERQAVQGPPARRARQARGRLLEGSGGRPPGAGSRLPDGLSQCPAGNLGPPCPWRPGPRQS